MRIEDDDFGGFRVRGLYQRKEYGWRIKTWPMGRREPEHDYWIREGQIHSVLHNASGIDSWWQNDEMGDLCLNLDLAERHAVLSAVAKWENLRAPEPSRTSASLSS